MVYSIKLLGTTAAIALACASHGAAAQSTSNEDSFAVGLNVQIGAEGSAVSGLEDISIQYNGIASETIAGVPVERHSQTFCMYTPSDSITLNVAGIETHPTEPFYFVLRDNAQTDPAKSKIDYYFLLEDTDQGIIIGGANDILENNVPLTFNFTEFAAGRTCAGGDNFELTMYIELVGSNAFVNELADGQLHSYTDTVTISVSAPNL